MVRTAEKIRSLLEEGEDMEEALVAVKRAADENGGQVAWEDVDDEITSGQWGRIIEEGILESSEDGFRFRYPDEVEQALEADDIEAALDYEIPEVDVDEDKASWTKWDKLAAGAAVVMMAGYAIQPLQNLIGNTINIFMGPLNAALPFFAVILAAALITGLFSTLLQANLMNTEVISAYKERMEAIKQKEQEAKEQGDEEAAEHFQQKQMNMATEQLSMFKAQIRPMAWIMLVVIPIFLWIWWTTAQGAVGQSGPDMILPLVGEVEHWNDRIIGPFRSWILWYIVCSISFTQLLRKSLDIRTLPT